MSADSCGFLVKNIQSSVNYFRAYVTPILTIVGVFGNAVALYLFATHQPRNRFAIYAMALAISDSLVLLSNSFLDDFVGSGLPFLSNGRLGVKLDALSVEACRLMELTGFWFIFTSGSLLVAFSLDRVACLFRPMQCRTNEGIKVALLVCGVIMALGLLLGLPQVMLFELSDRPAANTTQAYLFNESEQHNRRGPVCTLDGKYLVEFRFILVVVLTYLLPCVCLVITNVLIAYQLVKLKRRRHILCNTEQKTKQMHLWNASLIPDRQDSACPDSTISTFMERRRTTAQEGRREIGRVVALLILSCLHLCFSLPVSVSLALRASVPNDASQCQRHMYEHLTRLLTSIKDINYALNGFIYTFFFRFYRARLVRILSCGQVDMSKRPVNRIATGHGTAGVSLILNPPENYRRSIISSKCLPTSGCSG